MTVEEMRADVLNLMRSRYDDYIPKMAIFCVDRLIEKVRDDTIKEFADWDYKNPVATIDEIFEYFKNEPTDVLATAYMYAKNMRDYGVDITKDLDTAIQQQWALNQAYMKGIADEKARYNLYKLKCGRDYVEKFGKCPICTDCPDGCPLDTE